MPRSREVRLSGLRCSGRAHADQDEVARASSRTLPFASATLCQWLSDGPRHLELLFSQPCWCDAVAYQGDCRLWLPPRPTSDHHTTP